MGRRDPLRTAGGGGDAHVHHLVEDDIENTHKSLVVPPPPHHLLPYLIRPLLNFLSEIVGAPFSVGAANLHVVFVVIGRGQADVAS